MAAAAESPAIRKLGWVFRLTEVYLWEDSYGGGGAAGEGHRHRRSLGADSTGETAFLSPPWGGPDYAKVDIYDMKTMLKPCDGYSLFKLATTIASRVVMFLPCNVKLNRLAEMSLLVDPPWTVEVEKNFLDGKLKAITADFKEHNRTD